MSGSERAWRYIVVHHSDDESGCCAKYDAVHRGKGWDCCGYDFVIGNGTQTGDGQVEVGPRWVSQTTGAHAKTPDNRYNDYGVGIVLVGDFEHGCGPSARQYESLVRLTKWLMARYGISASNVLRHGDCKSTACPGKNFPWGKFLSDVSS
jgi:N-acetylmuramoyl-L-alanine amidase